jgi:hypothetical protein
MIRTDVHIILRTNTGRAIQIAPTNVLAQLSLFDPGFRDFERQAIDLARDAGAEWAVVKTKAVPTGRRLR